MDTFSSAFLVNTVHIDDNQLRNFHQMLSKGERNVLVLYAENLRLKAAKYLRKMIIIKKFAIVKDLFEFQKGG